MSYVATLAAAWTAAQAPREPGAPTVISTFAGRGGSSTGYHMAGYRELLAVEWDAHAADTLRLNYPHLDVHHGDIAALSVDEVLARTGLAPGELDVFDGSPPCQGFSTQGSRNFDDPRNQLFREYVRLLRGLRPRAFVMENVPGMIAGKMKLIFADVMRELRESGYRVTAGVLNAQHLGVPQARERVIFLGAREDLGVTPTLPRPTTRAIGAREAFEGLPDDPIGPGQMDDPQWRNIWARVKPGRGFQDAHPKASMFSYRVLHPDRPATTITKTISGRHGPGLYHWRYPRLLSLAELTRLGSFPDGYRWPGDPGANFDDFIQVWAGVGNSVPPLMMRAIAAHVRETILH